MERVQANSDTLLLTVVQNRGNTLSAVRSPQFDSAVTAQNDEMTKSRSVLTARFHVRSTSRPSLPRKSILTDKKVSWMHLLQHKLCKSKTVLALDWWNFIWAFRLDGAMARSADQLKWRQHLYPRWPVALLSEKHRLWKKWEMDSDFLILVHIITVFRPSSLLLGQNNYIVIW